MGLARSRRQGAAQASRVDRRAGGALPGRGAAGRSRGARPRGGDGRCHSRSPAPHGHPSKKLLLRPPGGGTARRSGALAGRHRAGGRRVRDEAGRGGREPSPESGHPPGQLRRDRGALDPGDDGAHPRRGAGRARRGARSDHGSAHSGSLRRLRGADLRGVALLRRPRGMHELRACLHGLRPRNLPLVRRQGVRGMYPGCLRRLPAHL